MSTKTIRILIVDDEPAHFRNLDELLKHADLLKSKKVPAPNWNKVIKRFKPAPSPRPKESP